MLILATSASSTVAGNLRKCKHYRDNNLIFSIYLQFAIHNHFLLLFKCINSYFKACSITVLLYVLSFINIFPLMCMHCSLVF